MTDARGLFFTSIPKGGKNLIYSFLDELGYARPAIPREKALWHLEAPWLAAAQRHCTYALPPVPREQEAGLPGAFRDFLGAVTALRPREVLHHHFPHGQELAAGLRAAGVPVVFVARDPRDLLLSMADYILVQKKPVHLAGKYEQLDRRSLIVRLWTGDEELISLPNYFAAFAAWRETPGVIPLNFESLVGEAGGGNREEQTGALQKLAVALGSIDGPTFKRACGRTFNRGAGTFFKGRRGRWREETEPEVLAVLQSPSMQALAVKWGYVD
jgi:hypothetical protein